MPTSHQLPLDDFGDIERGNPIDVPIDSSFPEQSATALARLESFNKHLYRPNTYRHKWWARRAGTTFRYILKQLTDDRAKMDFYASGGLEGRVILDPMMGGGTTIHEAIRMGASVIGIDIDPIPVLQVKASLTYVPSDHMKQVFTKFIEMLRRELSHLYVTKCPHCKEQSEIRFMLYGLRRKCNCREVIVLDSFLLRENARAQSLYICPDCHTVYFGSHHSCNNRSSVALVEKETRKCDRCGKDFSDLASLPYNRRYVPLVIFGHCANHGQFFRAVDRQDLELMKKAEQSSDNLGFHASEFSVPEGPKSIDLKRRNVNTFLELFTPRQLLYVAQAIDYVNTQEGIDRLWLSLLVSTSLEFNCLLAGYKGVDKRRAGAIRHVFSHHAYSVPYTALENNPVFSSSSSGTLIRLFNDRVLRASEWASNPLETKLRGRGLVKIRITGEVDRGKPVQTYEELVNGTRNFWLIQNDARRLDLPEDSVDYVVTDPPYYDSVQYSDLSNFFRVWLRKLLPDLSGWDYDQSCAAVMNGGPSGDDNYSEALAHIWSVCRKALKKDRGRLIFTFHHWRSGAWAALTASLKKAGFILANRYVVFSENPRSVHIRQLKALKHDVILVLKPRDIRNPTQKWPKIEKVNTKDSLSFCRDCGAIVGWLLNSNFTKEQIRSKWHALIGGQ